MTRSPGGQSTLTARALVNAGGPLVKGIIRNVARKNSTEGIGLVHGSHIVTKRRYDQDTCYYFQGTDGRIVFAIPYEQDFTLIGTPDQDHQRCPMTPFAPRPSASISPNPSRLPMWSGPVPACNRRTTTAQNRPRPQTATKFWALMPRVPRC